MLALWQTKRQLKVTTVRKKTCTDHWQILMKMFCFITCKNYYHYTKVNSSLLSEVQPMYTHTQAPNYRPKFWEKCSTKNTNLVNNIRVPKNVRERATNVPYFIQPVTVNPDCGVAYSAKIPSLALDADFAHIYTRFDAFLPISPNKYPLCCFVAYLIFQCL